MSDYTSQYDAISRALQKGLSRQADQLERLTAQIHFADQLRTLHPQQARAWEECIVAAGHIAQEGLRSGAVDLDDLVRRGEEALAPIGPAAKEYGLLCISHAHIDMNWMWSWPETVAVVNDTFDTMLKLMEEFPDFIFSQSQASVYRAMEQYNPTGFEAIRQRVAEGRWEVIASQWVEGDKNMSSGESLTRHLLYTREYFQQKFDLSPEDVTLDYEPDTFGHPATLPTILARGGVRYYYHCRGSQGPHLYWWKGREGSRILTLNGMPWYMGPIEPKMADPLISFSRDTGLKYLPVQYGVGDHGGGPTRRDLRRLGQLNEWPVFPRVECSSWHAFFRRAEGDAPDLPEVTGERNFIFTGCYTSQARQKWANRHNENLLYTAEAAAVIGEAVAGVAYPHQNLDQAWKHVLFDQFHDILPGSGMRDTRHYAMAMAQEGQAAAGMARTNALRALAARVNSESLRGAFVADPDQ
ncbi:alpha-mannosidase, partial [Candidatus Latescibacterota bacterium]